MGHGALPFYEMTDMVMEGHLDTRRSGIRRSLAASEGWISAGSFDLMHNFMIPRLEFKTQRHMFRNKKFMRPAKPLLCRHTVTLVYLRQIRRKPEDDPYSNHSLLYHMRLLQKRSNAASGLILLCWRKGLVVSSNRYLRSSPGLPHQQWMTHIG